MPTPADLKKALEKKDSDGSNTETDHRPESQQQGENPDTEPKRETRSESGNFIIRKDTGERQSIEDYNKNPD